VISIIDLVLSLLSSVSTSLTQNKASQEVISLIQAAIANLTAVQATPVTFSQLEGIRVVPTWPTPSVTPAPSTTPLTTGTTAK
jgi:hypothetical protein